MNPGRPSWNRRRCPLECLSSRQSTTLQNPAPGRTRSSESMRPRRGGAVRSMESFRPIANSPASPMTTTAVRLPSPACADCETARSAASRQRDRSSGNLFGSVRTRFRKDSASSRAAGPGSSQALRESSFTPHFCAMKSMGCIRLAFHSSYWQAISGWKIWVNPSRATQSHGIAPMGSNSHTPSATLARAREV